MTLKETTKKSIMIALKSENKLMIAVVLRKAAKNYYLINKRDIAIKMIKICLSFLNPTSQLYKLAYRDFLHYMKDKKSFEYNAVNLISNSKKEIPLKEISKLLIEI